MPVVTHKYEIGLLKWLIIIIIIIGAGVIVSEMTYNVSMGTLNPTIPYHTARHPTRGLRSVMSSPAGSGGGAPAQNEFGAF